MNKNLSKAIMLRTNLRNKYLKKRNNENKTNKLCETTEPLCFSSKENKKKSIIAIYMRKISAMPRHFGKLWNQCYPRKLSPTKE